MKRYIRTIVSVGIFALLPNLGVALSIDGEWVQGGFIRGNTSAGHHIQFLDRQVQVSPSGDFVVGLGRDAPEAVSVYERTADGQIHQHRFTVKQRQYNEQRIEGVPKKTVNIPDTALKRIREESHLVKMARKHNSSRQDFLDTFQWPLKGPITGVYGSRRVYNGVPGRPHYGLDIAGPTGSIVKAPIAGVITLVHDNMYFSGGTIIMDHGHGVSSTFIHLHKTLVKQGDVVKQGDAIGEVGATGRATGPHLDWRMNWFDQRLDPALIMQNIPQ